MANFAGQLISTRADKQMVFSDNVYDKRLNLMVDKVFENGAITVISTDGDTVLKKYTITDQYSKKTYEIDIPKDLVVTSGKTVHGTWTGDKFEEDEVTPGPDVALKLVIANQTEPVYINVAALINKVYTAGDGIDITDYEISAKRDDSSETFLTIGTSGIKLSGVQTAINTAVSNGVANKLTNINVNGVEGTVSNQVASLTVKGDDVDVADTYTATVYPTPFDDKVTTADAHVEQTDKVNEAFSKVEKTISLLASEVIDNETVVATVVNQLAQAAGTIGSDNTIGYQTETDATYISDAISVHDATVLLDKALKNIDTSVEGALTSVTGSDAITAGTKSGGSQPISLKLDTTNQDNALSIVSGGGLYLSTTIDCGTY
jgi:hypothetical protein